MIKVFDFMITTIKWIGIFLAMIMVYHGLMQLIPYSFGITNADLNAVGWKVSISIILGYEVSKLFITSWIEAMRGKFGI